MSVSHKLVPIATIKRYLGIVPTDPDQEVLLAGLENRAVALAEATTNRTLASTSGVVELMQGSGSPAIFARSPFRAKPVVELRNSVTEAWSTLDASFVEVDLTPPDTEKRRRRIVRLSNDVLIGGANNFAAASEDWFDNVKLTYDAGYALVATAAIPAAPLDLVEALLAMIAEDYRRRIRATGAAGTEGDPGPILPRMAAEILLRYTSPRSVPIGRLELA